MSKDGGRCVSKDGGRCVSKDGGRCVSKDGVSCVNKDGRMCVKKERVSRLCLHHFVQPVSTSFPLPSACLSL